MCGKFRSRLNIDKKAPVFLKQLHFKFNPSNFVKQILITIILVTDLIYLGI